VHKHAFAYVASVAEDRPTGTVIEIGGRDINGSVRPLFGRFYRAIDVQAGPGVDVVADGATYRPARPVACVVCCEVLEHTPNAEAICRNAYQMLRPGGVFIATMAGIGRPPHSAIDGKALRDGEYYRNVPIEDLRAWLSDFSAVTIEAGRGVFKVADGDLYVRAVK
jgi:SAM-dependent methyltransferase